MALHRWAGELEEIFLACLHHMLRHRLAFDALLRMPVAVRQPEPPLILSSLTDILPALGYGGETAMMPWVNRRRTAARLYLPRADWQLRRVAERLVSSNVNVKLQVLEFLSNLVRCRLSYLLSPSLSPLLFFSSSSLPPLSVYLIPIFLSALSLSSASPSILSFLYAAHAHILPAACVQAVWRRHFVRSKPPQCQAWVLH